MQHRNGCLAANNQPDIDFLMRLDCATYKLAMQLEAENKTHRRYFWSFISKPQLRVVNNKHGLTYYVENSQRSTGRLDGVLTI